MRVYGSLTNRIMESAIKGAPMPNVGDGATITHYSDRSAGTVIRVWKDAKSRYVFVQVQGDKYERTDDNGMSESQSYAYEHDPRGAVSTWSAELDANGVQCKPWREMLPGMREGTWKLKHSSQGLRIGSRDAYHDYSF